MIREISKIHLGGKIAGRKPRESSLGKSVFPLSRGGREFIIERQAIAYPRGDKTWVAISIDIAAADLSILLAAGSPREWEADVFIFRLRAGVSHPRRERGNAGSWIDALFSSLFD